LRELRDRSDRFGRSTTYTTAAPATADFAAVLAWRAAANSRQFSEICGHWLPGYPGDFRTVRVVLRPGLFLRAAAVLAVWA